MASFGTAAAAKGEWLRNLAPTEIKFVHGIRFPSFAEFAQKIPTEIFTVLLFSAP